VRCSGVSPIRELSPENHLCFLLKVYFWQQLKNTKGFQIWGQQPQNIFAISGVFDDPIPCQKCFVIEVENVEK
jgi:hypothetical protein